jgi:NAD/NADP transhydrogenase beta subunit
MADDYMDEKVGVAVAASAVVFSPKVRSLLHRGAVLGVSGVLVGADMIFGFLRGLRTGVAGGNGGNGRMAYEDEEQNGASAATEENGAPATRRRRRPAAAGAS